MTTSSDKLAVLIDADNAQASIAADLLAEIANYGTATVKRAYGDWTTSNLLGWKGTLHNHAIQPIQQFRFTVGKNATDSALIIDAMDLLHSGTVDGFCLVSSDSDFTRLATRMREAGLSVYGFGEKKTPRPFVAACDKFVFTEILRPLATSQGPAQTQTHAQARAPATAPAAETPLQPAFTAAIAAAAREEGWAALSAVGSLVMKADPSFDPRNYGYEKLGELVRAQDFLETKSIPIGDGSPNVHIFVRSKLVKRA